MNRKFKRNKIAATDDRDMVESIIDAGVDVVRLDFSDSEPENVAGRG